MLNRNIISGIIFCMMISSCFENKRKEESTELKNPEDSHKDTIPRTGITFILGRDESNRNPYFSLANAYYRLSDSEKTEIVIEYGSFKCS